MKIWNEVDAYTWPELKHGQEVVAKMKDGSKAKVIFLCCDYEFWFRYADHHRWEAPVKSYRMKFADIVRRLIHP